MDDYLGSKDGCELEKVGNYELVDTAVVRLISR